MGLTSPEHDARPPARTARRDHLRPALDSPFQHDIGELLDPGGDRAHPNLHDEIVLEVASDGQRRTLIVVLRNIVTRR